MKQVVLIADDFGLSEAANLAIIKAHVSGALFGASLMLGQPATAHAVSLAKSQPTLRIGWHLHLCDSTPTTAERWPWGNSPIAAGCRLSSTASSQRFLDAEIRNQWRLYLETGLDCSFVNAHHHLHVHPAVLDKLNRLLPADFGGWIRGFKVRLFGWPSTRDALLAKLVSPLARRPLNRTRFRFSDTLWGLDRLFQMNAEEIRRAMEGLQNGLHEFVFHPRGAGRDEDLEALLQLGAHLA